MKFNLYQQFFPAKEVNLETKEETYESRLIKVGQIEARSAREAIAKAKDLTRFRVTSGLARFPIVEEVRDEKSCRQGDLP